MPPFPRRPMARTPYWVRFSLLLGSMGTVTAVFVLVVLPQRFVLQAGLIESGITFVVSELPFWVPERRPMVSPPMVSQAQPVVLGPAEVFWSNALPLLEAGDYGAAIRMFQQYLAGHPRDTDVRREYANTLARRGRLEEAIAIYYEILAETGAPADRLSLARLLRDRGEYARSLSLYRHLVAANPDDWDLYHEFAQTLGWSEDYREAAGAYRTLLAARPGVSSYRLELARILFWDGYPINALQLVSGFPSGVPGAREAAAFRSFLDSLLTVSLPLGRTTLERARHATAVGDYDGAAAAYRSALGRDPGNLDIWLEWSDFLQYQIGDLASTRDALDHIRAERELEPAERFRLAQLDVWTGREGEAEKLLIDLLATQPDHAEAWVLLGDVYLWDGARLKAASAYHAAMALDPFNQRASEGIALIERQTAELLAQRESPRTGPALFYFSDSDRFERLDVAARTNVLWSGSPLSLRAGYRQVRGIGLDGGNAVERGPFVEFEIGRWWRLGSVRTSVTTGVERFDFAGTEPTLGARLELPDIGGAAVRIGYGHGRAFDQAATLESVEAGILSDRLEASIYRPIRSGWSLSANAAWASFHGATNANVRLNAGAALRRELSSVAGAALVSQFLLFTGAAPRQNDRRLYWDPGAFWSTGVQFTVHTRPEGRWIGSVRLTPGLALVGERDASGAEFVPQLGSEATLGWEDDRVRVRTDLSYLRGREGDYNSFALAALFAIKH